MAMSKAEMWVQWTRDATARYAVPEEVDDVDELVDDMSDVALKFADTMLDEFEARFEESATRKPRARKSKRTAEED